MNSHLLKHYALEYDLVDWIVLGVMLIIYCIIEVGATPHCRSFSWTDASISYPMQADTFPNWSLAVMVIFAYVFVVVFNVLCVQPLRNITGEPLTLYAGEDDDEMTVIQNNNNNNNNNNNSTAISYKNRTMRCDKGPIYQWIRALSTALTLELFIVGAAKKYAGRLRPDFLARLESIGIHSDEVPEDPTKHADFYCQLTAQNPIIKEGRQSFPSGHSGVSFVTFTFIAIYLSAHLRPFARQGSVARLLIAMVPLLIPFFCAISRTRDNKHNFDDVVCGSAIGIGCAFLGVSVCFRTAGGAAGVVLARSIRDIEYIRQFRPQVNSSSNNNNNTNVREQQPITKGHPNHSGGYGSSTSYSNTEHTIIIPMEVSSSASASPLDRGPLPRGVLVTEHELNENNRNAVPWI